MLLIPRTTAGWYRVPVRAVVVGMVLATTVVGCTSTTSGTGQKPSSSSGAATSSASTLSRSAPASPPAVLGSILQRIALSSGDLNRGDRLKLYPGADQVDGQVTLDNCGYDFTSEADRVARRQYGVLDAAGKDTGISNELVAYDSAAHAALALTQVRTALATCPKTPVRSAVAGVPALTYRVTVNRSGVSTLPASMNLLTVESAAAQGQTLYNVSVYQVQGRYLDAVYVNLHTPASSTDVDTALMLAAATGRRLVTAR